MTHIQKLLSKHHTHAELCHPDEIVYKESDLLEIIFQLTDVLYKPIVDGNGKIVDYWTLVKKP